MIEPILEPVSVPGWAVWVVVISDCAAGIAFISNAVALFYLIIKRRDFSSSWFIPAFGFSLLACGVVHVLLSISAFNGLDEIVVVATVIMAVSSIPFAVISWPIVRELVRQGQEPANGNNKFDELERRIEHLAATITKNINESTG